MRSTPARLALAALSVAGGLAVHAGAEVLSLKDGTSVDGKVMREDGGFIWVRTLTGTVTLSAAEVESRTEGESPYDAYERLQKAIKDDPNGAPRSWDRP